MPKDYLALVSPYGYYIPFYIGRKRGYNRDNKNFLGSKENPPPFGKGF